MRAVASVDTIGCSPTTAAHGCGRNYIDVQGLLNQLAGD
jgi:hypothetical protein